MNFSIKTKISSIYEDEDECRRLFKYLKSEHVGGSALPDLYIHWAKFELAQGRAEKALGVLQGALESSSLNRNPQILSAIEVLKITGKLNVASVLVTNTSVKQPTVQQEPSSVPQKPTVEQVQPPPSATSSASSTTSIASMSVLSTTSRMRRLGLGPPKRAFVQPSLTPISDDTKESQSKSKPNEAFKSPKMYGTEDLVIPTPPRQTMRHQGISLEPSPLSVISKGKLNYTGSPLTSAMGPDDDDEEESSEELRPITVAPVEKENIKPTSAPTNSEAVNGTIKTRAVKINGKTYRVLHLIGKGGSSKVFKVLAPDNQVMALKKVSLKNVDDSTLSGYVNEIELLKKLGNEETIIKLIDSELNRAHSNLYIVMEYGEIDLSQLLREKNEIVDYNFIRYCWQQMLKAVQAVHAAKVVHCDLKPANFLMVKGRLKLIDFGISKAIMSNDTTSVVRENQVGTVNYMSPEALQESSNSGGCSQTSTKGGIIKIGRPSDVWSLGCILYEMAYGKPPFANYSLIQRLQKIMDPNHRINMPQLDCPALLAAIRGCLDRNVKTRLTIEQLLVHPFLMPHLQDPTCCTDTQLDDVIQRLRHCQGREEARALLQSLMR